ncbi:hypothetical protein RRG08_016651 [Elysia crispata]|uniref:Uncharacterized protein n=1 Tax=Elysia crispata TaxID=231223 RepID=A0AAE1D8U0_9GAST|nr:hypothetical protein RRG08_016651 [Elysia crispata]
MDWRNYESSGRQHANKSTMDRKLLSCKFPFFKASESHGDKDQVNSTSDGTIIMETRTKYTYLVLESYGDKDQVHLTSAGIIWGQGPSKPNLCS